MNKFRRFGRLLAATTATATMLAGAPIAFAADADEVVVSVNNITDFHGHLAYDERNAELGVALLKSLMEQVNEGQDYVMTTSGDNVGGSAYISAISEDEYTLKALNELGIVASAVGNHEFDNGTEDLLNRIKPNSNYPILGANVLKDGQPLLDASYVEDINGVKVGFVGTVTENTAFKVAPAGIPGVTFTDPVEATNKEATRLKESGEADVVVALFHDDAVKYAAGFNKDVDLLFGGDSHQKHSGEVARDGAAPLVYAQGFEYGKILNDADITFDTAEKKVVAIEVNQYDVTAAAGLTPDAALTDLVAEAQAKADELGNNVVGQSPADMFRGSDEGKDSGSNRGVESTLNNFIAEAQRVAMGDFVGKDIDIAVMNAGGVRADLNAGETTYKEVFDVQPFGNAVAYGSISGADFIEALENQWKTEGSRPVLAMGLSNNVTVTYDPNGEQGARIKQVMINDEVLDPAKDYTIALSTFLIDEGDGFFKAGAIKDITDVGYMDTAVMSDYIKSGKAEVRESQAQVGVVVDGELKAGNTIKVELSSLNYSTKGEPMASTATVELAGAKASADIDNAAKEGDEQRGERGRATIELTIPKDAEGKQDLIVTTDAGTKAVLTLDIQNDNKKGGSPDKDGSSTGGIIAAVLGAILAIAAAVGFAAPMLPAPIREMIEKFIPNFKF